ncbi:MAG: hypothetical protein U5O69_04020 [Candidatus Competibacteraceae bacterium]|nr:hypothetical protein [Candidatus Competibacteraceae bacterium]
MLVVQLTESWKLERSRTALRDFVAHKLKRGEGSDNAYKEAGLIAFVAPDAQSWRFSYIRMEYETKRDPKTGKIKAEERLTPARRYSYRVGTEEECHTAQTRFLPLLQNTTAKPTLAQIEEAFSVESVTREFFNEYARLFKATDEALVAVRADLAAKGARHVDQFGPRSSWARLCSSISFRRRAGWVWSEVRRGARGRAISCASWRIRRWLRGNACLMKSWSRCFMTRWRRIAGRRRGVRRSSAGFRF